VQGVLRPEQWLCVVRHEVCEIAAHSGAKRGATAPQAAGGKPPGGLRGGDRHKTGARTRWARGAR
jgi:hypothetical protein